jgi:hypothetical protein
MNTLISELTAIKRDIEEWKKNLPSYYNYIVVRIRDAEFVDNPGGLDKYPYSERLDYVTG